MNAPRGGAGRKIRALGVCFTAWLACRASAAVFQSGAGRFEVAAADAAAAQYATALADDAWRMLAAPLHLPAGFSSPVFVRLVPPADWREPALFRTIVETGGTVTLRMPWGSETRPEIVRRALVQALLMRLAVAHHGVNENLAAPLWLELGCAEWWLTHSDAAQMDRLKHESGRFAPPSLEALLTWQRGASEPPNWTASASWLLVHLQAEAGRGGEWPVFLRRVLGGEEGLRALAASYPGRFGDARERELWWLTGFHHVRRVRTLPAFGVAESRTALAEATRFVLVSGGDDRDRIVSLEVALAHASEPFLRAEVQRRAAELNRTLPALHPFFRNAGLSLAEAFNTRRAEACAAFERDWRDALELQAATVTALDGMENARRR